MPELTRPEAFAGFSGELLARAREESHSDRGGLQRFIKSAACAEVEVLEPAPESIIMDSLWVLVVKCKLKKSLKK